MTCRNHADSVEGLRRCARCGETYCANCLVPIQGRLFCATCKNEELLDTRSGVDRRHLRHARFMTRLAAVLVDGVIAGVMVFALTGALSELVEERLPYGTLRRFLTLLTGMGPTLFIPLLYEALTLSMTKGQTVGKKLLRLRVVRADGSRISNGQAWARAGVRQAFAGVIVLLAIADYLPYFFSEEKTTLHDMLAQTRVVESR